MSTETLFDCNFIQNLTGEQWALLIRKDTFRDALKECFDALLVNTFNSECGFRCRPDGMGFSKYDTERAYKLNRVLFKEWIVDKWYARDAVLLLWKYRRQLEKMGISYPDCLFIGSAPCKPL